MALFYHTGKVHPLHIDNKDRRFLTTKTSQQGSMHTPGPWAWSESGANLMPPADSEAIVKVIINDDGCTVSRDCTLEDMEIECEANKALIAASPDLLAALKSIVLETMDHPPARPHSADSYLPKHLIELAQAAINKAEGVAA